MSLLQDYEMAREKIGAKKYDAINVYLEEICPTERRNKYKQELKKINNLEINEWEREKKKLEQKYGIVYLDDILYNEEGWKKFEQWYKAHNKTKNEISHKENNSLKDRINEFLKKSKEYKEFELHYILLDNRKLEDSIAIAFRYDEIIQINPYNMNVIEIPEWSYNFDEDIFKNLEEGKITNYMSMLTHYNVWNFIENYYPDEIEYKKGTQIYLKYCKQNNITKEVIDKENDFDDTPNIMKYYKEKKDRQR